jgi:hypothetical protein
VSEIIRIPLGDPPVAFALVDADAADRIGAHRWSMASGYAMRTKNGRRVWMHREVLGLDDPDLKVDHINRNAIDNRRVNLRVGTQAQNNGNKPPQEFKAGGSVYRGVKPTKGGKWRAKAGGNTVGTFRTELEAARAAEAYRREHMPFAEPDPRFRILPDTEEAA